MEKDQPFDREAEQRALLEKLNAQMELFNNNLTEMIEQKIEQKIKPMQDELAAQIASLDEKLEKQNESRIAHKRHELDTLGKMLIELNKSIMGTPQKIMEATVGAVDYDKSMEEGKTILYGKEAFSPQKGKIVNKADNNVGSVWFVLGRMMDSLDKLDQYTKEKSQLDKQQVRWMNDVVKLIRGLYVAFEKTKMEMRLYLSPEESELTDELSPDERARARTKMLSCYEVHYATLPRVNSNAQAEFNKAIMYHPDFFPMASAPGDKYKNIIVTGNAPFSYDRKAATSFINHLKNERLKAEAQMAEHQASQGGAHAKL